MKNELKVLETREVFGKEFRIFGTPEEPLFLAKDVANWIEHKKPNEMIQNVEEDEKFKIKINPSDNIAMVLQSNTEYWFLTENGLYEVLMQSRKPIAKQFKKEVKKILKEIRQYGYYAQGNGFDEKLETIKIGMAKQQEESLRICEMLNAKTNAAIYASQYVASYATNVQNHMEYMISKNNDYSQYNGSLPYMQKIKMYSIEEFVSELKECFGIEMPKNEVIHKLVFLNLIKYNPLYGYLEPLDQSKIFVNPSTSDICFDKEFYYDLLHHFKNAPRPLIYK